MTGRRGWIGPALLLAAVLVLPRLALLWGVPHTNELVFADMSSHLYRADLVGKLRTLPFVPLNCIISKEVRPVAAGDGAKWPATVITIASI